MCWIIPFWNSERMACRLSKHWNRSACPTLTGGILEFVTLVNRLPKVVFAFPRCLPGNWNTMGSKNCDLGFWQKWYKGLWDLFVRSFSWLRYDWTVSDSITFIIHPQKLHLICYTYFLDHTLPVVHGNPGKQSFVVESLVSETMKRKSYSKGWGKFSKSRGWFSMPSFSSRLSVV